MTTVPAFQGCFTYFFLVAFGIMGFMPLGRHSSDFSKNGRQLAYAYRLKEVRLLDVATRQPGPPLYTAPAGFIVDSVHWSKSDGGIYAVAHNGERCMNLRKEDGSKDVARQWTVRLLRIHEDGGAPDTVTEREYFCPDTDNFFAFAPDENAPPGAGYLYAYQELSRNALSFKPVGWDGGAVYYVEPEEFTNTAPAVMRMDLRTGKSEKAFSLPAESRMFLLSDDARYLAYIVTDDLEMRAHIKIRDLKSGKDIFKDQLVDVPYKEDSGDEKQWALGAQYLINLTSGVEGVGGFDAAAGKFFFLKMNADATAASLESVDLPGGERRTLYTARGIHAPVIIPQKKAVLITTFDTDRFFELIEGFNGILSEGLPQKLLPDGYQAYTALTLVSYDGAALRKHALPPLLSPLLHGFTPQTAVSPDGNLVTVNIDYLSPDALDAMNRGEAPAEGGLSAAMDVLPAIIDLERGTFDIVITQPIDNAAAGMYLYSLNLPGPARPFFDKYLEYAQTEYMPRARTLLTMFILCQELGGAKQKDVYDLINEKALIGAANRRYAFIRLYLNTITQSAQFDDPQYLGYCAGTCMDALPQFDALAGKQFEFIKGELEAAAGEGSANAAFLLGAALVREKKYMDAIAAFERSLDLAAPEDHGFSPAEGQPPAEAEADFLAYIDTIRAGYGRLYGELYEAAGEPDKALAAYTRYIDAEVPGYNRNVALEKRARLLASLGRNAAAIADYRALTQSLNTDLEAAIDTQRYLMENPDVEDFQRQTELQGIKEQQDRIHGDIQQFEEKIKELDNR